MIVHVNIPGTIIQTELLETTYWYLIDKICDILFSEKYNDYAVSAARSILNGAIEYDGMTWKQAKLIMNLNPK